MALLILFAVNLIGLCWQHNFNHHSGACKSTNTIIDNFLNLEKHANTVLLGSSLIKNPFWLSDIRYLDKTLDYDSYHGCAKLEKDLSDRELKHSSVFDFGIPGAMVSDVFLLTEKLLRGPRTPNLLIYAVGPRDFNDRVIVSEITTPTFDRLFRETDLAKTDWPYRMNFEQKVNFLLDRFFFAYRKRGQWQTSLANGLNRALDILSPRANAKPLCDTAVAFDTINTGSSPLYSSTAASKVNDECWNCSIKDYKARYASFNSEQFTKQLAFLKALIVTTKSRNIELILVSMPLTQQNIELMPGPLHALYTQTLRSVAQEYQTPLIDLQNDKHFDQTCFYDTAHLNGIGGDRLGLLFSKLIADRLSPENPKSARITVSETTWTQ